MSRMSLTKLVGGPYKPPTTFTHEGVEYAYTAANLMALGRAGMAILLEHEAKAVRETVGKEVLERLHQHHRQRPHSLIFIGAADSRYRWTYAMDCEECRGTGSYESRSGRQHDCPDCDGAGEGASFDCTSDLDGTDVELL